MPESTPLYEALAAQLRERIHAGSLEAGARVPSVRALSRQAGVSVGTVVQAYQQLEAQGVIVARPQSGYYVRSAQLPGIARARRRAPAKPRPLARGLLDQVLALYAREDLVPLHVAIPSAGLLPTARVAALARELLKRMPERMYGYVQAAGLPALRQGIAQRLRHAGVEVDAEDIVVTAGALEAITLALQALTRPGDAVLVESPAYYGLLQAIAARGLKVVEVPSCCEDGPDLECALRALASQPIRAAVLIPSFSNPSGALMPASARRAFAQACAHHGVPVIEDDVYGELAFDGSRPPPLMAHDEADNVVLCGSASKIVGPGLRVGWAVSPRWREELLRAKAFTSIAVATLSQHLCAELLAGANLERPLRRMRGEIAANVGRFRSAIARHWPPGTCSSQPRGGFVLWVRLPPGGDGQALFERASAVGIGLVPGNVFSASGAHRDCVRLSCAIEWEPRVEAALRTLGQLARV
ncbi:MAG: PLP-dependent aminotransferase family protein [Xanthomonadales bacterium]|nr:Histidinol-phosphate aminotransferase [Xanthomonadales bacterium]MCC6593623.1 PLP-dependent aminotransferase family protein [Xanthomonadales bacterium]MCE7930341.1 PLP-dependent aminotransferase family protein [Xanthomonadales bacterium PRO6]